MKIRKIEKSEFLPQISIGRRLLRLEEEEITKFNNPFKIESNTERVLAYGERARELQKLDTQKYNLQQQLADNDDYIENLSRKKLNIGVDRSGIITDVKQIKKIPHLPPHINPRRSKGARSPSPTSSGLHSIDAEV